MDEHERGLTESRARDGVARSRRQLIRCGVAAGGILVGATALVAGLPSRAASAPSRAQDLQIMNFALRLEAVQASLYAQAAEVDGLPADLRTFVQTAARHERVHLQLLRRLLGAQADDEPEVQFSGGLGDADDVLATAVALEDLTVEAYDGQVANLTPAGLGQLARIVTVDARHAAWARSLAGKSAAPAPQDRAVSARAAQGRLQRLAAVQ